MTRRIDAARCKALTLLCFFEYTTLFTFRMSCDQTEL